MASLHRDPRGKSPFWYCAFTDADGSRHFKSTKEVLRKKAQVVCDGWQRAAELARRGLLTQVQALKVVSEIYERANQEPLNSADTTTFLREWIASKGLVTAKSTARRYGDVIEAFLAHLGSKAARNLSAVAPADIATFRDACINAGKANKTANMEVKTLRIALNTARRRGMILSNPAEAVEALPENSVTRDVSTREQIQALLAAADVEWRGMILLGAYHGLRIGDAAGLTWANLDVKRRTIRYFPQKGQKNRQAQRTGGSDAQGRGGLRPLAPLAQQQAGCSALSDAEPEESVREKWAERNICWAAQKSRRGPGSRRGEGDGPRAPGI
jgi:integrase